MSSIAITFAACAYEQRHLPLQFLLLSQDEIENLAKELDLLEFDGVSSKFTGTLQDLTNSCRAKYPSPSAWLGLFATLSSFEWVDHFLAQDIAIHVSLDHFKYRGQDEMVKFLASHPKASDSATELMRHVVQVDNPEILGWFIERGILQKCGRLRKGHPIQFACYSQRWNNVRIMLESGLISMNLINAVLLFATGVGSVEGVKMALDHGATFKARALPNVRTLIALHHSSPQQQACLLEIEQLLR